VSESAATGTHVLHRSADVIGAIGVRPGGRELLALADLRPDVALVGGAVRDLLLGLQPRELDVTVARGAATLAADLAAALERGPQARAPRVTLHERFGTASVEWSAGRIDVAELRAESYSAPGALPEVRPGDIDEDLARRDFTVNAVALALGGPRCGELSAVDHALEDLGAGRLRVLHGGSFIDDPTRVLRMARYAARLGFEVESATGALADAAIAGNALGTVSGGRIAAELWLCTKEPDGALSMLGQLGVLGGLGLPAVFDSDLAVAARSLLPDDGSEEVLVMAAVFYTPHDDKPEARRAAAHLMDDFEFPARTRDRVLASAFGVTALAARLADDPRPSQLYHLLSARPVEAVAIAGALAGRESPQAMKRARRWLEHLRHVRLVISGEDLLAAGAPAGPEVGRRLERTLCRKLDGELGEGRQAELDAALEPGG